MMYYEREIHLRNLGYVYHAAKSYAGYGTQIVRVVVWRLDSILLADGWTTDSVTLSPYKYVGSVNSWYFENTDKLDKVLTNLVLKIMVMLNLSAVEEMPKAESYFNDVQPKDFKIDLSKITWSEPSAVRNHTVNWKYYIDRLEKLGLNVHAYDPAFTVSDSEGNSCVLQLWTVKVLLGEK